MNDKEIFEEFDHLRESGSRSKTARLRDLYDQIEQLRNMGFSRATILKAMKKHGLEFDLDTFARTYYRIKKERARLKQPSFKTERESEQSIRFQVQSIKKEEIKNKSLKPATQTRPSPEKNPFHALADTANKGDFNDIPKAKFEVDEN